MKQVYQTEDGAIFDGLLEAQQWERTQAIVKHLADFIEYECTRLDCDESKELATLIHAHYNVSPK